MKTATHRLPGLVLTDHTFDLPLDYASDDGLRIEVFGREVVAPERERDTLPWLVFFQGGPGFPSPRPTAASGWLKRALREFRVLLLDMRGTGLSTPVTAQSMARFGSARDMAAYLKHFRADAIVRDAEAIRRNLLGDAGRWTVLGQSYGGFCITTYLSFAPESLDAAILTGGLPPMLRSADEVYRATYRRVLNKNERYFERYPGDAARASEIAKRLLAGDVRLPTGDRLTARRFQQLGQGLGATDGFDQLHYLMDEAFAGATEGGLSYGFLRGVENAQPFDTNPIYAVLHEAIYCQGAASRWAAERVRAEYPEFDVSGGGPFRFTGEMIYPWMFDEYAALRPLRDAAHLLADDADWPPLYDEATLRSNRVPCAATAYYDDMYVDRVFAEETAAAIKGIRVWVTNQYEHNALRADGEAVLDRLLGMARGAV